MEHGTFNRASLRESTRGLGERGMTTRARASIGNAEVQTVSLGDVAKAHRAADLVSAKAQKHYEDHRALWVLRSYHQLLSKHGNTLSLAPAGSVSDPKTALMHKASRDVAARHGRRLHRIEKARFNAISGQPLRQSRKMEWGKGLGE